MGIDRVVTQVREPGRLPYADNMIDLLVISRVTDVELASLSFSEAARVVRPQGAIVAGGAAGSELCGQH